MHITRETLLLRGWHQTCQMGRALYRNMNVDFCKRADRTAHGRGQKWRSKSNAVARSSGLAVRMSCNWDAGRIFVLVTPAFVGRGVIER